MRVVEVAPESSSVSELTEGGGILGIQPFWSATLLDSVIESADLDVLSHHVPRDGSSVCRAQILKQSHINLLFTSDRGAKLCPLVVYSVCTQMAERCDHCTREIRFKFEGPGDVFGHKNILLHTFLQMPCTFVSDIMEKWVLVPSCNFMVGHCEMS